MEWYIHYLIYAPSNIDIHSQIPHDTMQARQCGLHDLAVKTLKACPEHQEAVLDALSTIISVCSGPMASGVRLKSISFDDMYEIIIKEGSLGDGVGAKLWLVARMMCRELIQHPEHIVDKTVLEIGAGVGACGILAGKIGAHAVVISDYVDQLLLNLQEALLLNFPHAESGTTLGQPGCTTQHKEEEVLAVSWERKRIDMHTAANTQTMEESVDEKAWTVGHVGVRFVDWEDSLRQCSCYDRSNNPSDDSEKKENASDDGRSRNNDSVAETNINSRHPLDTSSVQYNPLDGASTRSIAPGIPPHVTFDVIIGTDVLYEWPMTKSLPAVLHHRLSPGGTAFICNAIRDQEMFDSLVDTMQSHGLHVEVNPIDPSNEEAQHAFCKGQQYEGGYVWVQVRKPEAHNGRASDE